MQCLRHSSDGHGVRGLLRACSSQEAADLSRSEKLQESVMTPSYYQAVFENVMCNYCTSFDEKKKVVIQNRYRSHRLCAT